MRHVAALASSTAAQPLDYLDFVRAKIITLPALGLPVPANDVHPWLKPHCRDIVTWAVNGGRRAIFANFGLHKTVMQLECLRLIREGEGGLQLIIAPLNVILEGTFSDDGKKIDVATCFVRTTADIERAIAGGFAGQFLTNYESVREGKIDVSLFNAISLDEADCLRGFGGTKTFREFMRLFPGLKYKFVASADSVGLMVTSVPFGSQYEYSPSYNDFGHTDDLDHFFAQMDFLTPELLRALQPGRRLAVHVKDRVVPSGMTGLGFRTIEPFHARCIEHYRAHGFAYLGMITIVTDVVRENAGTYRLGWSEQCKDASGMGVGLPEYLLLFRKPPSDRSNGYAGHPVRKPKPLVDVGEAQSVGWDDPRAVKDGKAHTARLVPDSGYSRSRWQIDACSLWRSSGDRVLTPGDLVGIPHDAIYKAFRGYSFATVYDYEHHVALTESIEARHALPTDFALTPAQSWHPSVWTDVARMLGANTMQSAKGREQHLCPLPFDIVDRAIANWSEPGELVYDPFGGLMTVPMRAVKLGRRGAAVELNPGYFADGVKLLREQDAGRATPSLFDLLERVEEAA